MQVQYHLWYLIEFTINQLIQFTPLMFNKVNVVSIFIDRAAKPKTGPLAIGQKKETASPNAGVRNLRASKLNPRVTAAG